MKAVEVSYLSLFFCVFLCLSHSYFFLHWKKNTIPTFYQMVKHGFITKGFKCNCRTTKCMVWLYCQLVYIHQLKTLHNDSAHVVKYVKCRDKLWGETGLLTNQRHYYRCQMNIWPRRAVVNARGDAYVTICTIYVIFYMNNYIWQFIIFTGVGFAA